MRFLAIGAALAAPIAFASPAAGAAPTRAPATGAAAVRPPAVRSLSRPGSLSHYAFVESPAPLRVRPSRGARSLARLQTTTFWGTSTIVAALAQTTDRSGHSWTEIQMPVPPRNLTGWVPTEALSGLQAVHTWLRVDRERLTATLIRNRRVVFRAPIGVGQPQWPTPAGEFFVEVRIKPTEAESVYGALAFGTSAHSNVLTEWPNEGQIGIHGTNEPWLIPGRISHGCIRLRNPDVLRLARLMPVGTPITIQ